MICKNGILGGIMAFIRFYLVEAIIQLLIHNFKTIRMEQFFEKVQIFNQWYGLIDIETPINAVSVSWIIMMSFMEYGVLLFILKMIKKHSDFS